MKKIKTLESFKKESKNLVNLKQIKGSIGRPVFSSLVGYGYTTGPTNCPNLDDTDCGEVVYDDGGGYWGGNTWC